MWECGTLVTIKTRFGCAESMECNELQCGERVKETAY